MALKQYFKAFTLVELLAVIAITAVLSVIAVFYTGSYITWSQKTNNLRTLESLNTALQNYKTLGGMTQSHSLQGTNTTQKVSNIIRALQNGVTINGQRRAFLNLAQSISASNIAVTGTGKRFIFCGFGVTQGGGYAGTYVAPIPTVTATPTPVLTFSTWPNSGPQFLCYNKATNVLFGAFSYGVWDLGFGTWNATTAANLSYIPIGKATYGGSININNKTAYTGNASAPYIICGGDNNYYTIDSSGTLLSGPKSAAWVQRPVSDGTRIYLSGWGGVTTTDMTLATLSSFSHPYTGYGEGPAAYDNGKLYISGDVGSGKEVSIYTTSGTFIRKFTLSAPGNLLNMVIAKGKLFLSCDVGIQVYSLTGLYLGTTTVFPSCNDGTYCWVWIGTTFSKYPIP